MKTKPYQAVSEVINLSPADRLANRLAVIATIVYSLFFSYMSYFMYENMIYKDFDLAVHAQTLWNLAHGSGFSSILGVHFLANHVIPIFYPLNFVYRLFPSALTLLVLQSLALALGGLFAYRLATRTLSRPWSFCIAMIYFLYPPLGYANLFEFHPTTLAVPFIFLMITAYVDKSVYLFFLWAVLAMGCQENISLAVFMFGPIALIGKRKWQWIVVPVVVAATWFYISVGWIQPMFNKGTIDFMSIYSHVGRSWPEIIISLLTKPTLVLGSLFSVETFLYLIQIFGPLLLMPFVGWTYCLPLIPFFLQHILSERSAERTIYYHYVVEMIPFLMAGSIAGIKWFLEKYQEKFHSYILLLAFIASFLCSAILISPYSKSLDDLEKFSDKKSLELRRELLLKIPNKSAVVSTFQFLPILANRRELYSFHHVAMGTYTLSSKKYLLPESTEYALLDMNDSFTFSFEQPNSQTNLKNFFMNNPWEVEAFGEDVILLKKAKIRNLDALYRVNPTNVAPPDLKFDAIINDEIQLNGITMQMGSGIHESHVQFTFYWKCLKKTAKNYGMALTLVDSKGQTFYQYGRNICYRIHPTSEWNAGELVTENYWFIMPGKVPQGAIEVRMGGYDVDKIERQDFVSKIKGKVDDNGRVKLETFEPY
ncbi:MAG: hypothetical protein AUJ72_04480 [Candidatus Omnitrophica bacterium CG1_02_46_14]|nr:MAG: hypothetical protein AUJ72_04480 [Candidatus Omnitrophica bacterium CG1_02_46_14]